MYSSASRSHLRSHKNIVVLAAVVLIAFAAGAQQSAKKPKPYALLFGTMWDANNRPLPGVEIHIRRAQDKKAKWTLVSDNRGEFAQRVPPGTQDYVAWAEVKRKGEKHSQRVETKVHVDNDERVDFGLHLTE